MEVEHGLYLVKLDLLQFCYNDCFISHLQHVLSKNKEWKLFTLINNCHKNSICYGTLQFLTSHPMLQLVLNVHVFFQSHLSGAVKNWTKRRKYWCRRCGESARSSHGKVATRNHRMRIIFKGTVYTRLHFIHPSIMWHFIIILLYNAVEIILHGYSIIIIW